MRAHYEAMVRALERKAEQDLRVQNLDRESPFYGAFTQPDGVYQAKTTIYGAGDLANVYFCKESRFYHDETVLERALLGIGYVERVQHENGLFDYITCNFNSAPDTAFCILGWLPHVQYLRTLEKRNEGEEQLLARMERVVHAGGRGLLEGGFHTPNHRWAIASLLCACAKLFGEEDLTRAASIYLNEGMDCNGDGEYAEKSAGNYNRVNNDAMILLSQSLGDPSYEQNALRNLKMMLTYWEPDDTVFTANSTRFDKDRVSLPNEYYYEYMELGIRYHVPEFLNMLNYIMDVAARKQVDPPDCVIHYMLHPEYIDFEWEGCGIPTAYRAFYKDSNIARVRRGSWTYTVMGGKSNFLYVHNGSIKLEMKIGGCLCEHRAFKAETMEQTPDGSFHLHQTMHGWYYLPFEEKPATSDWWKMDNASRKKKLGPDMDIDVTIRETETGLDVELSTAGVTGGPWRVELAFQGIGRISSDHMTMPVHGDEVLVLRDGDFEVSNTNSSMRIGPAFGAHHFTEGKEDSEGKTPGAATVYLTDYTPFRHVVSIRP